MPAAGFGRGKVAEVGFDPTTCGLWAHRADHYCATLLTIPKEAQRCDEGGVRTHASEEIAALTQRLRPLGHLATRQVAHTTRPWGAIAQLVRAYAQ